MYIALWHCGIECPFSSKTDVQESHHRKTRGQGSGCGHVKGWVIMIIFSPVKRWWKKRLSQKSLVDEKRSGRPSILRKVQNMVISKSLHKRGQSTRKLASKLTIPGLQCSKDNIHRYLRFDLWSLFMPEACFTQNLQKSDRNWLQFFRGMTAMDSLKTWWVSYLQMSV